MEVSLFFFCNFLPLSSTLVARNFLLVINQNLALQFKPITFQPDLSGHDN